MATLPQFSTSQTGPKPVLVQIEEQYNKRIDDDIGKLVDCFTDIVKVGEVRCLCKISRVVMVVDIDGSLPEQRQGQVQSGSRRIPDREPVCTDCEIVRIITIAHWRAEAKLAAQRHQDINNITADQIRKID